MGELAALLERAYKSGWHFSEVIAEGRAVGLPAHALLRSVWPTDEWNFYDVERGVLLVEVIQEDWVVGLVEALGSVEEAQAAVDGAGAPACWADDADSPIDVVAHLHRLKREHDAQLALRALVEEGAPLAEIANVIASDLLAPETRDLWWARALRGRSISSILEADCAPEADLSREFSRRGSRYQNLLRLRAEVGAERSVQLGAQLVGRAPGSLDPLSLLLVAAVQSRVSMWEVFEQVAEPGAPAGWLPQFRRAGFDPNAAALACTEAGLSTAAAGVAMSAAGYSDHEVLSGLRACGRGIDPVAQGLADAGWCASRLAVMLHDVGALEPEVREVLRKVVGPSPTPAPKALEAPRSPEDRSPTSARLESD